MARTSKQILCVCDCLSLDLYLFALLTFVLFLHLHIQFIALHSSFLFVDLYSSQQESNWAPQLLSRWITRRSSKPFTRNPASIFVFEWLVCIINFKLFRICISLALRLFTPSRCNFNWYQSWSLEFGLTTLERSYLLIISLTSSFSSTIVKMAEGIKTPPKFVLAQRPITLVLMMINSWSYVY